VPLGLLLWTDVGTQPEGQGLLLPVPRSMAVVVRATGVLLVLIEQLISGVVPSLFFSNLMVTDILNMQYAVLKAVTRSDWYCDLVFAVFMVPTLMVKLLLIVG